MTLSIELLPAPLGPMMARISCSRTSKLTSVSACTPPKASDTPSTARITAPPWRPADSAMRALASFKSMAGSSSGLGCFRSIGRCRLDHELGAHRAHAPILEAHLRFEPALVGAGIKRFHDGGVFLGDVAAAHLARARELSIVGVELLVQDHETLNLAAAKRGIAREIEV